MFALLASLIFAGAAWAGAFVVAATIAGSRSRIADALQGRPLDPVRPALRGAV